MLSKSPNAFSDGDAEVLGLLSDLITAAMCHANEIRSTDLPLPRRGSSAEPQAFDHLRGLPLTEAKGMLIEQFERTAIESALSENAGNISAAARQLGLHRQSLQQKLSQLGINR